MNYFLEVSPLSLENLQQVKFSCCTSSKMICYSSYTLLGALAKQGGNSHLCYRATLQPGETTSPLYSPLARPPTSPEDPQQALPPPGHSPDPAQMQLEDTSAAGTPTHFSPTLGSPGPAAAWLLHPDTAHPKAPHLLQV